MTDPFCLTCNGSGVKTIDTTHYGECSGWNPGCARVRCDCNPMSPDELAEFKRTMREIGFDYDEVSGDLREIEG